MAMIRLASGGALLALVVIVTHVNVSDPAVGAILGVAVRTMAGTVQECRALSEEELAALPQHMRRKEVCETHAVPYRLEVRVEATDGTRLRIEERFREEESLLATGPAAVWRMAVELGGERRVNGDAAGGSARCRVTDGMRDDFPHRCRT